MSTFAEIASYARTAPRAAAADAFGLALLFALAGAAFTLSGGA